MTKRPHQVHPTAVDPAEPRGRPRTADFMILSLCVALIALLGRLVYLQVAQGPRLRALAAQQQAGSQPIFARRGLIFDRRGRVLAGTEQGHTLFVDPRRVKHLDEAARGIAPILNRRPADILRTIAARLETAPNTAYIRIARHIDRTAANAIRQLRMPGVGIEPDPQRRYPMGQLAAHVLGFVGTDGTGLEGIERLHDRRLTGTNGGIAGVRDARGRWIWTKRGSYHPPRDGGHVILTIDAAIQSFAETELHKVVEKYDALSGTVIVMQPDSGQILALACEPTFNPNAWRQSSREQRKNRALTDPVEPGSTFKPFIAATAIHEGVVTWDEIINCHQGIYFMPGRSKPIGDEFPYGFLPFSMVIIKSSNIGMAIIGGRLGNERLHQAVRNFGFGERTHIELPGEDAGLVWPLRRWTAWSTGSIPFGQELAVTPIQLARAFCALVNGGHLLEPRVVKAVLDADGSILEQLTDPVVIRRVLPESVIDSTRRVLARVVVEGTGRRAALDRWTLIGKTGTPQVGRKDGRGYKTDEWIPSFVCAAPADDPQVAIAVMIHCRNRGLGSRAYGGGKVAAPVAREIMAQTLGYLGVPPDRRTSLGFATRNAAR